MATKTNKDAMRLLLTAICAHCDEYTENTAGELNPQVVAQRNKALGRKELAEAVLDAINGCPVILRVLAGG